MAARNYFEERQLELLRQNSSDVTSVRPRISIGERLGEALENNTHVEELDLRDWSYRGENIDKLLLFIEQSDSLRKLSTYRFSGRFLQALSRRTTELDYLELPCINEELRGPFQSFLLTSPKIRALRLHFDIEEEGDDPFVVDQQLAFAATTAVIEQLFIDIYFPPDLLESFKENSSLRHVSIDFNQVMEFLLEPPRLQASCRLLRACKNAKFEVVVHFDVVNDWNREVWSALGNEFMNNDAVTELIFEDSSLNDDFCVELLPKLFQNTRRQLTLINGLFSEDVSNAVVSSAHAIDANVEYKYFLRSLAKPTSMVESINFDFYSIEGLELFVEYLPRFASLKCLTFELELDDDSLNNKWKRKILNALWRNRSLTKKIQFDAECVDDNDRAFMERILQRNKLLPDWLEPKRLKKVDQSLWPHLFKLSIETDFSEFFGTVRALSGIHEFSAANYREMDD